MLNGAAERFRKIPGVNGDPVVIMGMTLRDLDTGHGMDPHDFLARADMLAALGKTVMVSNFRRFDSVTSSLRRYTHQWLGFVMGVPTLRAVFDEQYYTNLPGGILEGLGRLFQGNVRLYVYPTRANTGGKVATSTTLEVAPQLQHLLAYLRERGEIEAIENFDSRQLHMLPDEVLAAIQNGTPDWEQYLPAQAAEVIKQRALFGYHQPVQKPHPQNSAHFALGLRHKSERTEVARASRPLSWERPAATKNARAGCPRPSGRDARATSTVSAFKFRAVHPFPRAREKPT